MLGSFGEEALKNYAQKVAEKLSVSFSESNHYDFTRCVRPDGSSYGTGGKCRKGTEQDKPETNDKPKAKIETKEGSNPIKKTQEEEYSKEDLKFASELLGESPKFANLVDGLTKQINEGVESRIKEAVEDEEYKTEKAARKSFEKGELDDGYYGITGGKYPTKRSVALWLTKEYADDPPTPENIKEWKKAAKRQEKSSPEEVLNQMLGL